MPANSELSAAAEPRRRRLPIAALLAWALFAFAVPRVAQSINVADLFAFPLGFFMAAQGSLIAFLVIAIVSARRQNRVEHRLGAADDE